MIPQPVCLLALFALSSTAFALQNPDVPEIIPLPQSTVARSGSFSLTTQMRIILGDGATAKDIGLAERFADLIERVGRRRPPVTDERSLRKLPKGGLYLATPAGDFARSALNAQDIRRLGSASPDEYFLDIREDGIVLLARTERGRFYGMMTLFALLRTESRRLVLPCVTIRDWPDRAVRGLSLSADWSPAHAFDRLRRLLPVFGLYKLNTILLSLPDDTSTRVHWRSELRRIQALASEYWVELRLDSSASSETRDFGPELRLGFLPPGVDFTSSVALAARHENSPPRSFIPSVFLEEPAHTSADWLDYCAAWIAQNSWSGAQADLGTFHRAFISGLPQYRAADECGLSFSVLQICPIQASWSELWIRPSRWNPCPHRLMRRHVAESLTAELGAYSGRDTSAFRRALSLRFRFFAFIAARLRAEEVLADVRNHGRFSPSVAVAEVLECLERLEGALLEANGQLPVNPQLIDLVGAAAFQRQIWVEIRERIETAQTYEDLMLPQLWMSDAEEPDSVGSGWLEFRRRFQCAEAPLQAKLVLSSFQAVVTTVNGSAHTGGPLPLSEPSPGHPATWVIDVTDHLTVGENLLLLSVRASDARPRAISATLELQFRGGAVATFGVDSLWRSRRVPQNQMPARPGGPWSQVALRRNLACQPLSLAR